MINRTAAGTIGFSVASAVILGLQELADVEMSALLAGHISAVIMAVTNLVWSKVGGIG